MRGWGPRLRWSHSVGILNFIISGAWAQWRILPLSPPLFDEGSGELTSPLLVFLLRTALATTFIHLFWLFISLDTWRVEVAWAFESASSILSCMQSQHDRHKNISKHLEAHVVRQKYLPYWHIYKDKAGKGAIQQSKQWIAEKRFSLILGETAILWSICCFFYFNSYSINGVMDFPWGVRYEIDRTSQV